MNGEPLLDRETLDALKDAIGDSVPRIINLFIDNFAKNIAEMHHALDINDFETVGRIAHSFKSSAANLGAMQISALSQELEHAIQLGEMDKAKISVSIDQIANSFDQTQPMFSEYIK